MGGVAFIKMHGAGNDFVIVDARNEPFAPTPTQARAIAERRTGVGCDQLIVIEPPRGRRAAAFMRILNADGGEVAACGNATRCVGLLLMREGLASPVAIETEAGLLAAEAGPDGSIVVDMGPVRTDWREIPLSRPQDTLHLELALGPLSDPVAVNVGNPHAVFFVAEPNSVDLARLGPELEHHPLFPERANVSIAKVAAPDRIRLRVWERGAGLTRACGTAACAALIAASRRGLSGRAATIELPGGALEVAWRDDNHVTLSGPVAVSFAGTIDPSLLEAAEATG
ncbi:MAG: diaminopimelate epimerase [Proteobacteria bacterium]|nr:diaminopimelate epimerase [Pseudomonadota bacterium]